MADPIDRPQPNNRPRINRNKSLKHAFDAGFLSGAHPPNNPDAENRDSVSRSSTSDPETSDSDSSDSSWLDDDGDLAASFRAVTEFAARVHRAELEAARAREASRLAAETRRVELDAELARVAARTQSQLAAARVKRVSLGRKRKRVDEARDGSSGSTRERAMLLSLLQCNLI